MKTLKITLALVAILVLTVSGVNSEDVTKNEPTFEQKSTNFDLLAHNKNRVKAPQRG